LQRACSFLRPNGGGPVAALWHERDEREIAATGFHRWLTVDARCIPGLPASVTGYVSVLTGEDGLGGRVEVTPSWPKRTGVELYAHDASVLPPIDAVFSRGSEAVGEWLRSHGLERMERYSGNFDDAGIGDEYERAWQQEYPIYLDDEIYAMLGGWHFPMADDDWHDLIDEQLMIFTLRDSEPWVEAWRTRAGEFRVIQRIT